MKTWQDVENWYRANGFLHAANNMGEIKWDREVASVAASIAAHDAVKICLPRNLKAQRKFNAQWGIKPRTVAKSSLPEVPYGSMNVAKNVEARA